MAIVAALPRIEGQQQPPGIGRAVLCVSIGLALGVGIVLALQVRSRADLVDRKWVMIGAGAGGAAFGAGVWGLWRAESRWRWAIGYYQEGDQHIRQVAFPLAPNSTTLYAPHSLKDRRIVGAEMLIGSPLLIVRKVFGDVLALLGSVVGLRDQFWKDLDRLARDVVYAVVLPFAALVTIFFPRTGQALMADTVRWANQMKDAAEIDRALPPRDEKGCKRVANACLIVQPLMPWCCQPMDDLDHPWDGKGDPKDIRVNLMRSLNADNVALTRLALARQVLKKAGPNLGVTPEQLAAQFTFGDEQLKDQRVESAVGTLFQLIGEPGRQQILLNDLASHCEKFSTPILA
jgi:hypothetical protein